MLEKYESVSLESIHSLFMEDKMNNTIDKLSRSDEVRINRINAVSKMFHYSDLELEYGEGGGLLLTDNIIDLSRNTGVSLDWLCKSSKSA